LPQENRESAGALTLFMAEAAEAALAGKVWLPPLLRPEQATA
jgi:hypothetical protein